MLAPSIFRIVTASVLALGLSAPVAVSEMVSSASPTVLRVLDAEKRSLSGLNKTKVMKLAGVERPKLRPKVRRTAKAKARKFNDIPSKSSLRKMSRASGGSEWACLTEALYFEARGESVAGIFAVAEVIVNRKKSRRFPNSICAVISQGAHRKNACQFSYKCDGHAEVYGERKAYEMVGKIAKLVLDGRVRAQTGGATYYHANTVLPRWARQFPRTARIGKHYFYKQG